LAQLAAPHSPPPLGRLLTLIPLWRLESPTTPSPISGELRRAPPLPYGASGPPRRVLPPDRGDSSSSPPIIAIAAELHPVDLALAAWSTPAGPAGASALASRCLRWLFVTSLVGW
jgi:hypothetical protein